MIIVIDMNLSPSWVVVLAAAGWEAYHWSTLGAFDAPDAEILTWARAHQAVVFTHDLDFGSLLAYTRAVGPSVIQVRTHDVTPDRLAPLLLPVLVTHEEALTTGALLIIDEAQARVRLLPLRP
jgi:predicted nuclease of predicted toxin-antitoxin system